MLRLYAASLYVRSCAAGAEVQISRKRLSHMVPPIFGGTIFFNKNFLTGKRYCLEEIGVGKYLTKINFLAQAKVIYR